jgi:hypothetical protein
LTYQKKLEARTYIGDERLRLVDPTFKPIEPGQDPNATGAVNSGLFEIPLYRSPRAGEMLPSEVGVVPNGSGNSHGSGNSKPPASAPEKPKD